MIFHSLVYVCFKNRMSHWSWLNAGMVTTLWIWFIHARASRSTRRCGGRYQHRNEALRWSSSLGLGRASRWRALRLYHSYTPQERDSADSQRERAISEPTWWGWAHEEWSGIGTAWSQQVIRWLVATCMGVEMVTFFQGQSKNVNFEETFPPLPDSFVTRGLWIWVVLSCEAMIVSWAPHKTH